MADKEKRLKLGVDVGELANQLISINQLTEQNYRVSIQGQNQYNSALKESLSLLKEQSELIGNLSNQTQNIQFQNNQSSKSTFSENDLKDIASGIELMLDALINIQDSSANISTKVISIENLLRNNSNSTNSNTSGGNTNANGGIVSGNREEGSKQSTNAGIFAGNAFNRSAGVMMQKNDVYMLAAMSAMIPVIGQGVSMIMNKVLQESEQRDIARTYHYSIGGSYNNLGDFTGIGLSSKESLQKEAQYLRGNVNLQRSDLLFEKGFGLSSGTMEGLLRSSREDISTKPSSELGNRLLNTLAEKINPRQVRGYSEEYLRILVDLNQKQLETIGETNSVLNSNVVASIAALDKTFKDPVVLQKVVSSLKEGLIHPNTPQVEALQNMVLSEINPEASIWDLQRMREDPFGKESAKFLPKMLDKLLGIGTKEDAMLNIKNIFGLSAKQTEALVNNYSKTGIVGPEFKSLENDRYFDISEEAAKATSVMQQKTAEQTNAYANMGDALMPAMLALSKGLTTVLETSVPLIQKFSDNIVDATTAVENLVTFIKNSTGGGKGASLVTKILTYPNPVVSLVNNAFKENKTNRKK